jgi:predicted O-methyltransferase YrrM
MSKCVSTKYYSFDHIKNQAKVTGSEALAYHLYLQLYEKAVQKDAPTILELGTNKGLSTLMFLQAVKEKGGHVYSLDIEEQYSDLTQSSDWTFICSDSTDVSGVLEQQPALKEGIDILLIDSLHKRSHIEKEFWGWEPYLKEGALIIFDDIDPTPYGPGARKDNLSHEFDWHEIRQFVEELFYANEDSLFLEMHFGSTGFAVMTKRTKMSQRLNKHKPVRRRTDSVFWPFYIQARRSLRG